MGDPPARSAFRIETERLILRDWRRDDVAAFVAHTNTPAVMRWLGGVQDAAFFDATFARFDECRRDHGHCFWVVERKAGDDPLAGELLGFCGLKRSNAAGAPMEGAFEIGWRLRQDAWGRGYAREAAQASLAAGFGRFGAPRINALTVIQNTASWRLMERLGMSRAPDLDFRDERFGDEIADVLVWSLTAEEWHLRNGKAGA